WLDQRSVLCLGEETGSSILSSDNRSTHPESGPPLGLAYLPVTKQWAVIDGLGLRTNGQNSVPHRRPAGPALRGPRHLVRLWFWSPREPRPARGRHCGRRRPHPRLQRGRSRRPGQRRLVRGPPRGRGDHPRQRRWHPHPRRPLPRARPPPRQLRHRLHLRIRRRSHPPGFKEEDTPNSVGSFCSKTKAMVCDAL
ncbi:unnamed protein product, partial [Musa textilis]